MMLQEQVRMKQLSQIDKVYNKLHEYASVQERLKYCTGLVQRIERFMSKSNGTLTDHIVNKSSEIIQAARNEIQFLTSQKNNFVGS